MAPLSPPSVDTLVPPFLAHLPTAYTSPKPPPTLLPLLAPILRQRLTLLSSDGPDSWLPLLSWSSDLGADLSAHLSTQDLSPHPSSGEFEVGYTELRGVRRLDEETIRASVELCEWGIVVEYLWVDKNDLDEEEEAGWKVVDVHTVAGDKNERWYPTVEEAEKAFAAERPTVEASRSKPVTVQKSDFLAPPGAAEDDDNDDYWNMYDNQSSAQTPAGRQAEVPDEDSYFSRYYGDEEQGGQEHTQAQTLLESASRRSPPTDASAVSTPPTAISTHFPGLHQSPQPQAPTSDTEKRLLAMEAEADRRVSGEVAIRQHISTSMKSLYRLSRASGMDREEFVSMIQTELSVLSMLDQEGA